MKDLLKSKMFIAGAVFGIFLFVALNFIFPLDKSCDEIHLCKNYGFPFPFYLTGNEEREGGVGIEFILWTKLVSSLLFGLLISFLSGFALNLLTEKD